MKNNRILIVLIVLLVIWNLFSVLYFNYRLEEQRIPPGEDVVNNITVSGFSTDLTEVVKGAKESIVTVNANGTVSSGFLYAQRDGFVYVLTTYHGVSDDRSLNVIFDSGTRKEAVVKAYDIFADLALLEVEFPFDVKTLPLGDSDLLKDGEFLLAIGTPVSLEYQNSAALTMVSSKLTTLSNSVSFEDSVYDYFSDMIQLGTPLSEGYSGSALLNMAGEAVGICVMSDESGITFALPINEASLLAERMLNEEDHHKSMLGIKGSFVSEMPNYERSDLGLPLETTEGYYISRLKSSGIAYMSGLRQGDVLLSVNDIPCLSQDDLLKIAYSGFTDFRFKVLRGGEEVDVEGDIHD